MPQVVDFGLLWLENEYFRDHQLMINWNGCWEKRVDRYVCRWILAWSQVENIVIGCIGGYSGGGSFQLEKFILNPTRLMLTSDSECFNNCSESIINKAEDCQDKALSLHEEGAWLACDNLVLMSESEISSSKEKAIIYAGDPIPKKLEPLFEAIGLLSKPKTFGELPHGQENPAIEN